ncbi:MAG TPA: TIGR02453 family protein [Acidimicrobiia bacterium]
MGQQYFTPGLFNFLRELATNNNKKWWDDNNVRYIEMVREPSLRFIADFGDVLDSFAPHFKADARKQGGSLIRPYRDIRFSKDKTPYKTNVGIQFRHESGKDVHAPGFYLHLEPSGNFAGVGLWSPDTRTAHRIRQKINDEPHAWKKAAHSKSFSDTWSLSHPEESLQRVPKLYQEDHPFADDIRLKSFMAGTQLTQRLVTSGSFLDDFAGHLKKTVVFNRFLCEAVGLPY